MVQKETPENSVKRSLMRRKDMGRKVIDDRHFILRKACHGNPERCYWHDDRPLPFCARCIFFYPTIPLGTLLGFIMVVIIEPSMLAILLTTVLLISPLVIDGMTQYQGLRRSTNLLRSITGAMAGTGSGIALAILLIWIGSQLT
jgi:uncharacterized membrane protein